MNSLERQHALDRARQGDSQAFGELLESFRSYVRAMVGNCHGSRLQGRANHSDLVQDVFVEIQAGFAGFRGTTLAEFVAWLRRIALRTTTHTVRDVLARPELNEGIFSGDQDDFSVDPGSSPSEKVSRQEQETRVTEALAQLPLEMQQVLLGRFVDALPHAQIAAMLGKSEAAIRVAFVRGLSRLRELCKE